MHPMIRAKDGARLHVGSAARERLLASHLAYDAPVEQPPITPDKPPAPRTRTRKSKPAEQQ